MKIQTKAIYNLLRLNAQETSGADVEPWALENLRDISLDALFQRLSVWGISLDKNSFISFAAECDTPEDLAELLQEESVSPKQHDQVYLLIFELWRRFLPEKQSLSIFCDDLEGFIYDYITELLDGGDVSYAQELAEGFFPFLPKSLWTQFLRARILSFSDPSKANAEVARILDKHPDNETPFLFETLRFLSVSGEHRLFIAVIQKIIAQLQTEEEFEELLEIAADYYRRLDQDDVEMAIERLMKKRSLKTFTFDPRDPDLKVFAQSLK